MAPNNLRISVCAHTEYGMSAMAESLDTHATVLTVRGDGLYPQVAIFFPEGCLEKVQRIASLINDVLTDPAEIIEEEDHQREIMDNSQFGVGA